MPVVNATKIDHVQGSIYIPPQIVVERRSKKPNAQKSLIFGRKSLAQMTYDEAMKFFTVAFAVPKDGLKFEWDTEENNCKATYAAVDKMSATFYVGAGNSITLHPSAWPEVLENMESLAFHFYND